MVSIIIPAYNAAATLDECLRACRAQSYPDVEIMVVDDGSADDTARIVAQHPVQYVSQENSGPAAARNRGAALARGDVLVFTDSDCVPEPDWVVRLMEAFGPGVAAVGGSYGIANPDSLLARVVHAEIRARHAEMEGEVDFLGSFNMAVRADAFRAIGGFDQSFRKASAEDNDLAYRLQDAGGRLIFAPDARVAHYHPTRTWPYLKTQARHGYWRVKLYRKHRNRARRGDRYAGLPDLLRPPLAILQPVLLSTFLVWPVLLIGFIAAVILYESLIWDLVARFGRQGASSREVSAYISMLHRRDLARGIGMIRGIWDFVIRGKQ